MNELSLFTGAGGGILGTHGLLGWRCLGYVEWEEYAQRVIRARIEDGILDEAPIFSDVREFVDSGAARKYRGYIDVVSGGFPCQPFSVAGKRLGEHDERDMWPATLATISAVRPRYAFLENVRGLITGNGGEYFRRILGQLSEIGYDSRWCILSAADCGAPHKRDRLWIVAHADGERELQPGGREREVGRRAGDEGISWWDKDPADGPTKPRLGRVANGVAHRLDRLKAIGNGQVPVVAATAWEILTEGLGAEYVRVL